MQRTALALSLFAAALLSSCAQWQLGEHLSDSHTTYTGVDLGHPVDGRIYRPLHPPSNGTTPFYITAPEVRYKLYPHTVLRLYEEIPPWLMYASPCEVQPTGRTITACVVNGGDRGLVAQEVSTLPSGLIAEQTCNTGAEQQHMLAILSEKREPPGLVRRALIGTCDYLLDPLLTLISTPVYVACILVEAPFIVQQSQGAALEKRAEPQPVPDMPHESPAAE